MINDNDIDSNVKMINDVLVKGCISIILFGLYIQYSLNSFMSYYYGYSEIVYHSGILNSVIRLTTFLTFTSIFILLFLWIARKRFYTHFEFIFILLIASHLIHLLVFTRSPASVIFDISQWGGRFGIVTIMAFSLVFYASDQYYWDFIKKIIKTLVLISFLLCAFFLITKVEIYISRAYAYKWLHGFGVALRLGMWMYLLDDEAEKIAKLPMFCVYLISLICLQARIYLVDYLLQLVFIFILMKKNKRNSRQYTFFLWISIVIIAFLTAIFVFNNIELIKYLPQNVQLSTNSFLDRFFSDTRSGQADSFMPYFWDSFPFGVGYNTNGIPSGLGEQGIDNGYLNAVYIAGLPMVLIGCAITHLPIIKAFRRRLFDIDVAVISRGLAWIIILTSSATITYTFEYVFFILVAGRCLGLCLHEGEMYEKNTMDI